MTDNKITLSTARMRQIARYEITFKDIISSSAFEDGSIICPDVYTFTLEDLYHALKALKAADPTVKDFGEDWFYPITNLSEAFDIERACGWADDADEVPESMKGYPGLNVSDSYYFEMIWWDLENAWEDHNGETHLSEILDFDETISDLERYLGNKGKPIEEWIFSEEEMKDYIRFFNDDDFVKKADESKLALARKFIDELCEKDSGLALYTKGYACYGGNRLYSCDWNTSRDCMIRLFEKEDDPQYANTLGYIYYYGRCNGGVPEYEEAFRYFGIAAANGLYEGMYKLADMFRHGYACKKSSRTARNLYGMVYEDSLKHFLKGKHASFADAALRMGNVYAKGIGEEADLSAAYYYYTQADYAAKLRARDSDFFGNTTVVINIQKALEETAQQLPDDYFKDYMEYEYPHIFQQLAENNNRCTLSRIVNPEGRTELLMERTPTRSVPDPEPILLTIPQLKFCERTLKISLAPDEDAVIWFKDDSQKVKYDCCEWNDVEDRFEFYYDDELTAWVRSEHFRFYGRPAEEPSGPEYRLVSVRFGASGRSYDYICEDPSVQAGDTVIVEGYDGETEVEVIKVMLKRESELGLPVERYKKILRKA